MATRIMLQTSCHLKWLSQVKPRGHGVVTGFGRCMASQSRRAQPGFRMPGMKEGGYVLLIIPVVSTYLALWQLRRKKWKEDLIAKLENAVTMEPVPLPDDLEELKDMEFKAVYVDGEFQYDHETYIGPRSDVPPNETLASNKYSGVHVITPFKLADRDLTIMINRGWLISKDWENDEKRRAAQVHGRRRVVGIVRKDQETTWLVDTSKPGEKRGLKFFLRRDLEQLAKECQAAPVFLDAVEEQMQPGAPKGIRPAQDLRNDHLQYALTWFFVTGCSLGLWLKQFGRPLTPAAIHRTLENREAVWNNRKRNR